MLYNTLVEVSHSWKLEFSYHLPNYINRDINIYVFFVI